MPKTEADGKVVPGAGREVVPGAGGKVGFRSFDKVYRSFLSKEAPGGSLK